jgi:uncharacterized membrane protein
MVWNNCCFHNHNLNGYLPYSKPRRVFRFFDSKVYFSFIFVSFLPGYCLVNVLFTGKNKIDLIETLVLSVALSFGLAGLIGLFLGLSPIGIGLDQIAVSLSVLVLVLATIAFVRKRRENYLRCR